MSDVAVYLVVATYDYEGDAILSSHPDFRSAVAARDMERARHPSGNPWVDVYAIPSQWSWRDSDFTDLSATARLANGADIGHNGR
jgi:hypothetical protein